MNKYRKYVKVGFAEIVGKKVYQASQKVYTIDWTDFPNTGGAIDDLRKLLGLQDQCIVSYELIK